MSLRRYAFNYDAEAVTGRELLSYEQLTRIAPRGMRCAVTYCARILYRHPRHSRVG